MLSFTPFNIKYDKHPVEKWVIVRGEIRNDGEKGFSTAAFRLKLLIGHETIGSAIFKMQGFRGRATKPFEVMLEGTHRDLIPKITGCEISFESGF